MDDCGGDVDGEVDDDDDDDGGGVRRFWVRIVRGESNKHNLQYTTI